MTGAIALLGACVSASRSRDEGRHTGRGEYQSRTVQQLVPSASPRTAFVIGLSCITLKYPLVALGVSVAILILIVMTREVDREVAQESGCLPSRSPSEVIAL
jgi:hypothetical protein